MTFLVVAKTAWICPGAIKVLGVAISLASFPEAVKVAMGAAGICAPQPTIEVYDPARKAVALGRLLELGHGGDLLSCRIGHGCRTISKRRTVVELDQ
jgi:hypothetical protein